eukprot:23169-Amphidinium_carterae.1
MALAGLGVLGGAVCIEQPRLASIRAELQGPGGCYKEQGHQPLQSVLEGRCKCPVAFGLVLVRSEHCQCGATHSAEERGVHE